MHVCLFLCVFACLSVCAFDIISIHSKLHDYMLFSISICYCTKTGGRRGSLRGAYQGSGGGYPAAVPPRPNLDRPRHGAIDRGHGKYFPFRQQPFFPEEDFDNSFSGRHFDDPYLYEDNARGIKRPFIPVSKMALSFKKKYKYTFLRLECHR